jgi:hypothetical protein
VATIVTRDGKGSALTWAEADANFTNLNTDKLEDTDLASLTVNITTTGTVTSTAVDIDASSITTGTALDISDGDALTTGTLANIVSNSSDAGTRSLVTIHNDHASATGTTALEIVQDSTGNAITTDGNTASDTFEATGAYTVAGLPAGTVGQVARVTDADAGLAWGATAINSGAGATAYLCWFNGVNWTVIGS